MKGFALGLALKQRRKATRKSPETWHPNNWPQQKLPKFGFRTHRTKFWPMEQSSILSAKFDCPVAVK